MDKRIVFVHGLGGNAETWGNFKGLIEADASLNSKPYFWKYPTTWLGVKVSYFFQKKYQGVQDLAKSLKTYIDETHFDADEIILVGHSLGGLVIRQYLLNEALSKTNTKIRQVVLYAVPNNGAELASLCKLLSLWNNPHLWDLVIRSNFLENLNKNWKIANLEETIEFTVVVAGNDKIVSTESAEGIFRYLNLRQISGVGHLNICKPENVDALAYVILRNVLTKKKYIKNFNLEGVGSFEDWQRYTNERKFEFQLDDARKQIFDAIVGQLHSIKSSLRIKGLSGLGKTRLIYEAILSYDPLIRNQVAYLNASSITQNLAASLKVAIEQEFEGILIVDNCKPQLHIDLTREVLVENSKILLITLDHSLDNLTATNDKEWLIGPMETSKIRAMLEPEFGGKISDLDRVAGFAQGFPQMAVLISRARLANENDVGILNDDELAKKLLGSLTDDQERILRACSLFHFFGSEAEVEDQYKFIADRIAFVSHQDFYNCIKTFESRGLIDISGRFCQLVPKPLAVRMASEWWRGTSRETQLQILEIIPDAMIKQFCTQVTMLGFMPQVQQLTVELCGVQGPFGQAEVILSKRGSLLFRSFVEVNPEATSSSIYRLLTSLTQENLLAITGDIRRNLVWALEMLAFHAELFESAAWCLFLLAKAENESWSNNSSGMFSQLFDVYLSGTEANYQVRINLLNRILAINEENPDKLVISAIKHAISTYGSSRTIGAEFQGNKPPLKEYKPEFWQEIFNYWQDCFDILLKLVEKKNRNSVEAAEKIGYSIRTMVTNGRIDMLEAAIVKVVSIQGPYWPSALDSIKTAIEYDYENLPELAQKALNRWLDILSPESATIEDQFRIIVINPPWEHRKNAAGHYVDIAAEKAESFAKKQSLKLTITDELITLLSTGDQNQTFSFAKAWAAEREDSLDLIDTAIHTLLAVENPNYSFLMGLLQGWYLRDEVVWNKYIEQFGHTPDIQKLYPFVIRTGKLKLSHLQIFVELIKSGVLSPYTATTLGNGGMISHLESNEVGAFCDDLSQINSDGSWAALDVLFMYCFSNNKFEENKKDLKKLALKVPLNEKGRSKHSDIYHWKEIVEKFLDVTDIDFARSVCEQIVAAANEKLSFEDLHHSIKPVLIDMIKKFGDELWPYFGSAILKNKSHYSYLTPLFDKEDNFSSDVRSPLMYFSIDVLINWAKEDLEFAPYFLARSISVFDKDDEGHKTPSAMFVRLLESFGNLEQLGGELRANIATRGWSGSLVPYLVKDRTALIPLLSHHNENVRKWTREYVENINRSISYEAIRDAETNAGIR